MLVARYIANCLYGIRVQTRVAGGGAGMLGVDPPVEAATDIV